VAAGFFVERLGRHVGSVGEGQPEAVGPDDFYVGDVDKLGHGWILGQWVDLDECRRTRTRSTTTPSRGGCSVSGMAAEGEQRATPNRVVGSGPLPHDRRRGSELVVVMPLKDWACASCGAGGAFLTMDDAGPLCMTCAELDQLVFLPAGDAALTRRAKRASRLSAVVVRFSRARGRYERQGVLVEEPALEQAESACLADAALRARRRERDAIRRQDEDVELQSRMTAKIASMFPRCPHERAQEIARHAAARGSGRVGRSAGGRQLEDWALELAVTASIRHRDTTYDELLMAGMDRNDARELVRDKVAQVLDAWRTR
jgi:hypothetical protein